MANKLTKLELDVLRSIVTRTGSKSVGAQVQGLTVAEREYTGSGFYVKLAVSAGVPPIDYEEIPEGLVAEERVLCGPSLRSPGLDAGGGAVVFLVDGRLDTLELFANGDRFPKDLPEYEVVATP